MLGLNGVIHVVGGPDVLHGRVLTALLRPEERVLSTQPVSRAKCAACESHSEPCRHRCANSWRGSMRFSDLDPHGYEGCCSFCQVSQVPESPSTLFAAMTISSSSAAIAVVSSMACTAPRSTSCARCPASSRRLSTSSGRPMIYGGGATHLGGRIRQRPGGAGPQGPLLPALYRLCRRPVMEGGP